MLYLAPADDPDQEDGFDMTDKESMLPTREQDEYKGFARKLREMDLWVSLMTATAVVAFLSCFQAADVEVAWQILVAYFIFVTAFLCRYKIEHMVKYGYIPFEIGKKSYDKNRPQFA